MAPGHGVARRAMVAGQTGHRGGARMERAVSDAGGTHPAAGDADLLTGTVSES
jgi:hypothetical protein